MTTLTANALPRRGPEVRPSPLTGTGALIRHIVRRDRVRMSVWVLAIVGLTSATGFSYVYLYDDEALAAQAAVMRTPTGIVMGGPGYGLDEYTAAAATANELTVWLVLALSVLSILHVIRHTRGEEDASRAELVRALPVGRFAHRVAATVTLAGLLGIIAVLSAAAIATLGGDFAPADAAAMMVGSAASALVVGGVALVAAEVAAHSRTATGISLAALAAFAVVRAAGDVLERGGSALSWFSPIAWAQQMRAFVDVRWWPILLSVAAAGGLIVVASAIASRRDLGAGLVAPRPGRDRAARALSSPFALAWREQRGSFCWTGAALALLLFAVGTMMSAINDMMSDLVSENEMFAVLFGDDPAAFSTGFVAIMLLFVGLGVAALAVSSVARVAGEESSGRLEVTLAHPVSRAGWFGSQLAVSAIGALAVLAVSVLALWGGAAAVGVEDPAFADAMRALAFHAPAVLAFAAGAAALIAWIPRGVIAAWGVLAAVVVIEILGPLFELPGAVLALSPFHAAEGALSGDADPLPALVVAAVAVCLTVLAFVGFGRRDVRTG